MPRGVPLADIQGIVCASEEQAKRVYWGLRQNGAAIDHLQFIFAPDIFNATRLSALIRAGARPAETDSRVHPMVEEGAALDWADRVRGSLMASAAGDALGWPIEPRGKRVGGTRDLKPQARFIPGRGETADAGHPMRKTSLKARTRMTRNSRSRSHAAFGTTIGGGISSASATGLAAVRHGRRRSRPSSRPKLAERQAALDGHRQGGHSYYSAGANGVAMRIAPHCFQAGPGGRFDAVRAAVLRNGLATHGHPRALVGAQLFAYACSLALGRRRPLGFGELVSGCISGIDEWALFESARCPTQMVSTGPRRLFRAVV